MFSIIAAVSLPSIRAMVRANNLRSSARTLANDLTQARGMVVAGRQDFPGWTNNDRTENAGIRWTSTTQYVVFADRDTVNNGAASEVIIRTRTLAEPVTFANGPAEIRFRRNGTLAGVATDLSTVITDVAAGRSHTIRVAFGGKADIIQ